jgi:hypothetical protein
VTLIALRHGQKRIHNKKLQCTFWGAPQKDTELNVLLINEIDLQYSSAIIICKRRINMIATETLHPQYLKTKEGESSFVVLPVVEFESLIEDYNDLTVINQRREEPKISLAELKAKMSHA